jgi:hypothetical protein
VERRQTFDSVLAVAEKLAMLAVSDKFGVRRQQRRFRLLAFGATLIQSVVALRLPPHFK